jgi:hypothetical protein
MVRNAIGCEGSFSLWKLQILQMNLHSSKECHVITTEDNLQIKAGSFGILERTIEGIQKHEICKEQSRSMSLLQMGLDLLWLSWVDNCLVADKEEGAMKAKASVMELFHRNDLGTLLEYVGCKVNYDQEAGAMRLTHPLMIQSFQDDFDLPEGKDQKIQQSLEEKSRTKPTSKRKQQID